MTDILLPEINQKERIKRFSKYKFKIRISIKIQNPNIKTRIYIKALNIYKPGVTKCGKMGLQSVLGWGIPHCGNNGLQSVLGVGLQSVAKWITKCVKDYKVWRDYKVS